MQYKATQCEAATEATVQDEDEATPAEGPTEGPTEGPAEGPAKGPADGPAEHTQVSPAAR